MLKKFLSDKLNQKKSLISKGKNSVPTIITHAVVGIASGKTIAIEKKTFLFWTLSVICPILPDADVIGLGLGIPYGHFFGHRGFFHSPFFALILSLIISLTFFRERVFSKSWWKILLYFFIITASHGILDAFTNGGLGIALLSPFDNTRYFFPYTPVEVSPIGARAFFTNQGLKVLASEIKWIWMPLLILCISLIIIRKILQNNVNDRKVQSRLS
ncbi:Metal-dependent hydrolase, LexA-binding [Desulfonema limicola]|uniref:Metal-dependent hydrolase, LexA-binding n=1 Tax=Desulfonema limicola TaxID=45656 RepID=A0A975GER2_9BACT|nr:Metal-dependent hydrolase, LexA-binding [Desulfonema limicola]